MGDFNEVRTKEVRFGSVFNRQGTVAFNTFISNADLEEDFHYWFEVEGFDKLVEDTWNEAPVDDSNAMCNMLKKLKYLKEKLCAWNNEKKRSSSNSKVKLQEELIKLDTIIDKGEGTGVVVNRRSFIIKSLQDMKNLQSLEVAQKSKIKWGIEGYENSKYYHGILNKKRSQITIRGIMAEDDAVFVGQWCDSNIDIIVHVLDYFNRASRLRINMNKSKLMGVAVEDDKFEQAAIKIGCVTIKTPFCYLGLKVGGSMSRIQSWNVIIDRVVTRLSKWKMKTLSIGGRLTLIKVIKAIHGVDGKIGTGIKSNFPSIWVDIIHEAEKIKEYGIDLVSFIHKKLGNGDNMSFWEEKWSGDTEFKKLYPRLYSLEINKNITVASKLFQHSLSSFFHRVPRGGAEKSQLDALTDKIKDFSLVNMMDRWVWSLEGSGDFSVASVRKLVDNNTLPEVSIKSRWVKEVPIKVNILAWKIRLDGLPTRLNLSRRGLDIDSIMCPICENAVESTSHIFYTCYLTREIFRKISCWLEVSYSEVSSYEEWLQWILNIRLSDKYKKLLEGVCYIMWWHIWTFRNKSIFGVKIPSKAAIFEDIVFQSYY
ncbi:RNA-directed DNA polymerase, eukaryota, reverse transcriptase zinc-binding domain protein [Tanacetum coccineum]